MNDAGTLFAALVQVYRRVDGAWKPVGQAGVAVLGGSPSGPRTASQVCLYEPSTKRPFSISNISVEMLFEVEGSQYASFQDDQKNSWSVYFATQAQQSFFLQVRQP